MTATLYGLFVMLAGVGLGYLIDRAERRYKRQERARLAESVVDKMEGKK